MNLPLEECKQSLHSRVYPCKQLSNESLTIYRDYF